MGVPAVGVTVIAGGVIAGPRHTGLAHTFTQAVGEIDNGVSLQFLPRSQFKIVAHTNFPPKSTS